MRNVPKNLARSCSIAVGSFLAGVLPVEMWADTQRAANAAASHAPNMDPGVVTSIALIFALVAIAALLVIEMIRCMVLGDAPLSYPAYFVLGVAGAWPVSYTFIMQPPHPGILGSALGVFTFYITRHLFLVTRKSNSAGLKNET